MSRARKRIVYAAGGVAAALLLFFIVEGVLRCSAVRPSPLDDPTSLFTTAPQWSVAARYRRDPALLWRARPSIVWSPRISTNSLGFRGPEWTREKPPETLRIAALGDACTFASRWPEVLANVLDASRPCEVQNFGVVGYSSLQGRRLLDSDVASFAPDLVLISFGLSDYTYAATLPDASLTPIGRAVEFLDHSYLVRYLARRDHGRPDGLFEPRDPGLPPSPRVPLDAFSGNLAAMIARARQMGAIPVLLDIALRPEIPLTRNPRIRETQTGWAWDYVEHNPVGWGCRIGRFELDLAPTVADYLERWPDEPAYRYYAARVLQLQGHADAAALLLARVAPVDADRHTVARYNEAIAKVAEDESVPLVKLSSLFAGQEDVTAFIDECHPGDEGSVRIGEFIAQSLLDWELVPPR